MTEENNMGKVVPTSLSSNGGGTPSPSLSPGLGHGPSRGGGLAPGCVLGSSPHAGRDCGTCDVGSFLWSGCGLVPWNAPAWQRHKSITGVCTKVSKTIIKWQANNPWIFICFSLGARSEIFRRYSIRRVVLCVFSIVVTASVSHVMVSALN